MVFVCIRKSPCQARVRETRAIGELANFGMQRCILDAQILGRVWEPHDRYADRAIVCISSVDFP